MKPEGNTNNNEISVNPFGQVCHARQVPHVVHAPPCEAGICAQWYCLSGMSRKPTSTGGGREENKGILESS
jgi:hypothetical protein